MYHTALAASHTLDIDQLLQRIMELIFEWVEADRGCVMLLDRDTDQLVPTVRRDRKARGGREDGDQPHDPGLRPAAQRGCVDQRRAARMTGGIRRPALCAWASAKRSACRCRDVTAWSGVIYIDTYTPPGRFIQRPANRFSAEHLKLMVAIGHQAALAVEDTSYYSAMVQAERLAAIGQTIATLSHHIKNILQGIRGGSYLIEEGLKSSEFEIVSKGWAIVDKNQDKISNLVMDMLSFSKEREPEMVPADINSVVTDVVELMQSRAADARRDARVGARPAHAHS